MFETPHFAPLRPLLSLQEHAPTIASTVRVLLRCLNDYRCLWRSWVSLLALAVVIPPVALSMPFVEKYVIDEVVLAARLDRLPGALVLFAVLWLIAAACNIIMGTLRTYVGEQVSLLLRQRLFLHCEALSVAFSQKEHSGRTMSLFFNDTPAIATLTSSTVTSLLSSLVAILVGAILTFSLNWQLAIVAAVTPPLVAVLAALITRPLRPASRRAQDKAAELSEHLQENLTGLREIVAFGRERQQGLLLARTLHELLRLRMRVTLAETGLQTGQSLLSLTLTMTILGFGSYLVIRGDASIGTLVAMRTLYAYLYQPAQALLGQIASVQRSLAAADRVYTLLDRQPAVQERPTARPANQSLGTVRFDSVDFAYQPGRNVLSDISLTAHRGETVALVGPSGAGKSTLASLIARFFDPTAGRVLLGEVDLRDLTLRSLRRQVGFVFQDTFLFSGTIRDNIAFGQPQASEQDIIAAAVAANAWEFIKPLDDGLNAIVGERGVMLSEGQKQRLAIARALLRNPRILILDEPTAALDARSERLLQSALETLVRGRTTFVIAHRLATIQRADQILVLDQGHIVERGTHTELLRRNGLYRHLFDLQFGTQSTSSTAPQEEISTQAR